MAVKINYVNDTNKVKFNELNIGDMFEYCNRLYMRIQNVVGASTKVPGNAILMVNGALMLMKSDSEVRVVDVEMKVLL